jgi:hypothetical protein
VGCGTGEGAGLADDSPVATPGVAVGVGVAGLAMLGLALSEEVVASAAAPVALGAPGVEDAPPPQADSRAALAMKAMPSADRRNSRAAIPSGDAVFSARDTTRFIRASSFIAGG